MSDTFSQFVDDIKTRVDIAEVIEGTGVTLKRSGRNFRGPHGLVVCPDYGNYFMYGQEGAPGWTGDFFSYLKHHGGKPDFWGNVLEYAKTAGVAVPDDLSKQTSGPGAMAFRATQDMWDVCCDWLQERLWATPAALTYARGRGWTDATIRAARLGFTGVAARGGGAAGKSDLRGDLQMYEHDPNSAAAVAILGLDPGGGAGGVQNWCAKYDVDFGELPPSAEKGRLWGMLDFPRLVYPHIEVGRVTYFSARNLKWDGDDLIGEPGKNKAWNLPKGLVGPRKRYKNFAYARKSAEVVVGEGPADGITWGQMGAGSTCLVGTGVDDELVRDLGGHDTIFLAMDNGARGREAIDRAGELLGATSRVITFPIPEDKGEDANDWLQAMLENETVAAIVHGGEDDVKTNRESLQQQKTKGRELLDTGMPFVLWITREMEASSPLRQEMTLMRVARLCERMETSEYEFYREVVAKAIGKGVTWVGRQIKEIRGKREAEDEKSKKAPLPEAEFSGRMIRERVDEEDLIWMVDVCFDSERGKAHFAYRSPEGEIGEAEYLEIGNVRYVPPSDEARLFSRIDPLENTIILPSGLGERKTDKEIVDWIHDFLNFYYYWADPKWARLSAYYVMLTWIYDAFSFVPYYRALGDYDSGKSQLTWRVGHLCYRFIKTTGATTMSPIFRILDEWGGTLWLDELDAKAKEKYSEFLTILLTGYQKGMPVLRSADGGGGTYKIQSFNVYGPKMFSNRERFLDRAMESRCLTYETVSIDPFELQKRGVAKILPKAFYDDALKIRNMLLRWRLTTWHQEDFTDDDFPVGASTRLQQVTAGLLKLANDPALKADIEELIRNFTQYEVAERAMTFEARILEALIEMAHDPELQEKYKTRMRKSGQPYQDAVVVEDNVVVGVYCGAVAWRGNRLMDAAIEVDSGEEGPGSGGGDGEEERKRMTGKGVAETVKRKFGLVVASDRRHRTNGTPILYNVERIDGLRMRYGL